MTSTPKLSGRTALVTGSTSGIGEAIAALAAAGAHVLITGRDTARGNAAVDTVRAAHGKADFAAVDLGGSADDLRAFATEAVEMLGGQLDLLVNNAGLYPSPATADLTDGELDAMLAVNIRAPYILAAALLPGMAERGHGTVINIGSWMAQVGSPIGAMYTATKAAIEQLTRSWAAEFGPRGVRVNTVAPGVTLTPGNAQFRAALDQLTSTTPAGTVIEPDDIADAVVFLASDAATKIHGTTLYVDGGISATKLG